MRILQTFLCAVYLSLILVTPAGAITREAALTRADEWVEQRVMYSQKRYHQGYRQDCSGFVSMAWRLDKSYTTRTIHTVAQEVELTELEPADAVWTPGHIVLFVSWEETGTTFLAAEESTWGKPARYAVKKITSRSRGYRNPTLVWEEELALEIELERFRIKLKGER